MCFPGFNFSGSWDDFFAHVQAGQQLYGDQYEWYKNYEDNKDKGDFLFLAFEDLKADIRTGLKKLAEFLEIPLSDKLMEKVVEDVSITKMKTDKALAQPEAKPGGQFIRSGQSGGWKKYFTVAQNEWFDNKYKELYEKLTIPVYYE